MGVLADTAIAEGGEVWMSSSRPTIGRRTSGACWTWYFRDPQLGSDVSDREPEDDTLDRLGADMENPNSLLRVVDCISDEDGTRIEEKGASEFVQRMRVLARRLG